MLLLLAEFQDSPWIGAWHDFGHVQRKANLGLLDHAQHLQAISPRLLGCHVHDVQWPAKDHRVPLSTGGVDFDSAAVLGAKEPALVWELSPSQRRALTCWPRIRPGRRSLGRKLRGWSKQKNGNTN